MNARVVVAVAAMSFAFLSRSECFAYTLTKGEIAEARFQERLECNAVKCQVLKEKLEDEAALIELMQEADLHPPSHVKHLAYQRAIKTLKEKRTEHLSELNKQEKAHHQNW
jgi:hypothetical protein